MQDELVHILMIGDIVGRVGREVTKCMLPQIKKKMRIDLTIANAENAAGGFGLTPKIAEELFCAGVDLLTSGNHIWRKKEVYELLEEEERVLRPFNYPLGAPGRGSIVVKTKEAEVGVVNLCGRVFVQELDCPFKAAKEAIRELKRLTPCIIVDMHAEVTSEKVAMGWFLDGEVSAVLGTHTHIQTADERILPKGTAYITDVGMTGPRDSVIGIKKEAALRRFTTQIPVRFEVAKGVGQFCAVWLKVDKNSGCAKDILRIQKMVH